MKRALFVCLVAASMSLSACDAAIRIRGTAPSTEVCVVKITDAQSGQVANVIPVSGEFEEFVYFAGAWRAPRMTVSAECEGEVITTVKNPKLGELDLGKIEP